MANYNTVEIIYAFLSLTSTEVQPSVIQTAIDNANAVVLASAPLDDSDRSIRLEAYRKLAEKFLACGEIFSHYANAFFLSLPPLRILGTSAMQLGADSPNPLELLDGLHKRSQIYKTEGFFWLAKCKPVSEIQAGIN